MMFQWITRSRTVNPPTALDLVLALSPSRNCGLVEVWFRWVGSAHCCDESTLALPFRVNLYLIAISILLQPAHATARAVVDKSGK